MGSIRASGGGEGEPAAVSPLPRVAAGCPQGSLAGLRPCVLPPSRRRLLLGLGGLALPLLPLIRTQVIGFGAHTNPEEAHPKMILHVITFAETLFPKQVILTSCQV